MRLSELRDKRIRTNEGEVLGRIHEVHSDRGKIIALMCGPGSLLERWTARKSGHRIPWETVRRIEPDAVIVATEKSR